AEARLANARTAVQSWLDADTPEHRGAVDPAVRQMLEDWRDDEFEGVRSALGNWQERPSSTTGERLLAALDEAGKALPAVELIWLDIGGGTSQIAKYVTARFEASRQAGRDGIDIDLLFGGGTDIFVRFGRDGYLEPLTMPPALMARV